MKLAISKKNILKSILSLMIALPFISHAWTNICVKNSTGQSMLATAVCRGSTTSIVNEHCYCYVEKGASGDGVMLVRKPANGSATLNSGESLCVSADSKGTSCTGAMWLVDNGDNGIMAPFKDPYSSEAYFGTPQALNQQNYTVNYTSSGVTGGITIQAEVTKIN